MRPRLKLFSARIRSTRRSTTWTATGETSVFKGTVKLEGEDVIFEFATIIGKPATWREVLRFTDKDTMQFTIFGRER